MPRSKTQISKLPRDLKEPIEFGRPALDWSDAQVNEWSNERRLFVVTERLRKLEVLMQEMKAPRSDLSAAAVLWLCIELAKKRYPGFRTDLDGTKRKGRPKRGKGDDDHLIDNPATSLMFVDAMGAWRGGNRFGRLQKAGENQASGGKSGGVGKESQVSRLDCCDHEDERKTQGRRQTQLI
jgi:hypothetical protein